MSHKEYPAQRHKRIVNTSVPEQCGALWVERLHQFIHEIYMIHLRQILLNKGLNVSNTKEMIIPNSQCLGNHELDESVTGLIPFIKNLTSPVVTANLILKNVPELQNEPNFYNSVVLLKGERKIGIIGYLTPETKYLVTKNAVEYEDEIISLRREVTKLKQKGVDIIIALGHSGFLKDLEIAKEVDELDLVIGGHSNTFLCNNNCTDEEPEVSQGPYPTIVTQSSGRLVPVVQAYAYTKYMGKLHLIFDDSGELLKYEGDPILLNQKFPRDPDVLKMVNQYHIKIDRIYNEVVGSSSVFLDGKQCRLRECNLGDFINDAILVYTKENFSKEYSDVNIALTQGGRIRASINRPHKPFELTRGDWMTVIPFTDTLAVVTMNGSTLMQTLEHSVETWRMINAPGRFLQLSGMKVVYDLLKPPGSRVVTALVMCSNCTEMTEIHKEHEYKMIMSGFLANGGDGYSMFDGLPQDILPFDEITCVLHYLSKHGPVTTVEDNRIVVLNEDKVENIPDSIKASVNIISKRLTPSNISTQLSLQYYVLLTILFLLYRL